MSIFLEVAYSSRASEYFLTGNIDGADVYQCMSVSFLTLFVLNVSSLRYIIFWGAPPHFTGIVGRVKIAYPPLNSDLSRDIFSAYGSL